MSEIVRAILCGLGIHLFEWKLEKVRFSEVGIFKYQADTNVGTCKRCGFVKHKNW